MKSVYSSDFRALVFTTVVLIGFACSTQQGQALGATTSTAAQADTAADAKEIPAQPERERSPQMLSAQFTATVYEVQGTPEQLRSLEDKALADRADTTEALVSALARFGKSRLLFHTEQPVNVFSTSSAIGASEPVVMATRTTPFGSAVNLIRYVNVGFIVQLSAEKVRNKENGSDVFVTTAIQLSTLSPGEKELAPGQRPSVVRSVSLERRDLLELDRPRIIATVSSRGRSGVQRGAAEEPVTPIGYVIRYRIGPPAQSTDSRETAHSAGSLYAAGNSAKRLTTRFQATVYEVEPTTEQPPLPDGKELMRAATPGLLLNSLAGSGNARILYRIDQPVNVLSDQVTVETNKMITTGMRVASNQKPVTSSTSRKMGVRVRFSAETPPNQASGELPDVMMSLNLSTDVQTTTEVASGLRAMAFPVFSQEHQETLELGRPRIMVAVGLTSKAEQARPFIYVMRYQFDAPENR